MRVLKPLKVKIGLKKSGSAQYPNFNQLQTVISSGMDWSVYVDKAGDGWHYDKQSGHTDDTNDSPHGQQWGVLLVPETFVAEAVATFPEDCEELNEEQFEEFYDKKAHAHEPDEEMDEKILTGIKLKQDMGIALTQGQQDALDPEKEERGITKNKRKKWADYKALKNITIKQ